MTKDNTEQLAKFKQAAREAETDDREEVFDRALKVVAGAGSKEPEPPKKTHAGKVKPSSARS